MKKVSKITAERVRELLTYEPSTGILRWTSKARRRITMGAVCGSSDKSGYLRTRIDTIDCYLHRLIWLHQTGEFPKHDIDHINGDKKDNRWINLRSVNRSQNQQNKVNAFSTNHSGLIGAHVSKPNLKNKFASEINVDGKRIRLGSFFTAQEAHEAYMEAKLKMHPFASRAFPQCPTPGDDSSGSTTSENDGQSLQTTQAR